MQNQGDNRFYAAFLADHLRYTLRVRRLNRQPWTKKRIADDISTRPEIDGVASETTLGRFLDANHPQRASHEPLRAVESFLLYHRYVEQSALDLYEEEDADRLSPADVWSSFAQRSEAERRFHMQLAGRYEREEEQQLFRVQTDLRVLCIEGEPLQARLLAQVTKAEPQRRELRIIAAGAGCANADLIAFILCDHTSRPTVALTIEGVCFDDEAESDEITSLRAEMRMAWEQVGSSHTPRSNIITSKSTPQSALQILLKNFQLKKVTEDDASLPDDDLHGKSKNAKYFSSDDEFGMEGFAEIENIDDGPDSRLINAYASGNFILFKELLTSGADPHQILGNGDYLIYDALSNARLSYAAAIIEAATDIPVSRANGADLYYFTLGLANDAVKFSDHHLAMELRRIAETIRPPIPHGATPIDPAP